METALEDEHQQHQPNRIKTSEDLVSVPPLLSEIVFEILSRLPVESLLRCKSVCKSWLSLISDPHFIKSHLITSTSNNQYTHHKLIFYTVPRIHLWCHPLYDVLHDKPVNALELDYPLKHSRNNVWVAGSCNGLLFIAIEEVYALFIWNPSTRKLNRLPYFDSKERDTWSMFYGFGYDESTEDYKVVVIYRVSQNRAKNDTKVNIYSLKTGSWKKIDDFPHCISLDDSGTYSNGALHWAVSRDSVSPNIRLWNIVSIDLANETYGEVVQPVYDEGVRDMTLGALRGWLCVLCNYRENRADLWAMTVCGVKDSWTKLVSIPYLVCPARDQFSVPLCIRNDGKVLLQFGLKLVMYDSKNSSFTEIQNVDECLEAYTYVESLVSPCTPSTPWR